MVVSGASIEVDVYFAVANGLDETLLVEVREFQHIVVEEILLAFAPNGFALDLGTDVKAVL